MRKLIYVPMVHSPVLAQHTVHLGAPGKNLPDELKDILERYWKVAGSAIKNRDFSGAKIYFESITEDWPLKEGSAHLIKLSESSDQSIPEIRLLREMLEKGATLQETDSSHLLNEFSVAFAELGDLYRKMEKLLEEVEEVGEDEEVTSGDIFIAERVIELYGILDVLNERRDETIASKISETLNDGEMAFLFVGASHDVIPKLPSDIHVELLDESLKEFQDFASEGERWKKAEIEGFAERVKSFSEEKG